MLQIHLKKELPQTGPRGERGIEIVRENVILF